MRPVYACLIVAAASCPALLAAQDAPPKPTIVPAIESRGTSRGQLPREYVGPPTSGAITPGDLMTRVYKFADDSMMGRLAGTPWNDKGTDYIESEVRRLGLTPAGENGTFFQHPLVRRELLPTSSLAVGDRTLGLWTDFAPRDQGNAARPFDGATVVFAGTFGDTASYLPDAEAAGRIVLLRLGNRPDGTPDYNVNREQLTARFPSAAAIAVIQLDYLPPGYVDAAYRQSQVDVKGPEEAARDVPSYFYVTRTVAAEMLGADPDSARTGQVGRGVRGSIVFESKRAPGRNVVAILPGSDPRLRGQFVAIGAHNDHIGFSNRPLDHDSVKAVLMHARRQGADSPPARPTAEQWPLIRATIDSLRALHPSRQDSIYNGADDDASGSMSVLEIAESFAMSRQRPKRSLLFVWHVGEELGLFGSQYFTDNPTVERDSIVAQLNIDMVGRGGSRDITGSRADGGEISGGPGYVQLIGSRRLSTELGDLIERVNTARKFGLAFDYALDANGHPQNIYCRSDHYEYARYGIPIAFFTTGGHADYHQVTDEPQYVDYERMATISSLVLESARTIANLDHRVVVDKEKPDPKGSCQQ